MSQNTVGVKSNNQTTDGVTPNNQPIDGVKLGNVSTVGENQSLGIRPIM